MNSLEFNNVIITINRSQFIIKCQYNHKIVDWIRKQEKRFWDHELKIWYLPLPLLQDFTKFLNSHNIVSQFKEQKLSAMVKMVKNNEYELKFNMFNNAFKDFVNLPGVTYDRRTKKFSMNSYGHKETKKLCLRKNIEWNEIVLPVALMTQSLESDIVDVTKKIQNLFLESVNSKEN